MLLQVGGIELIGIPRHIEEELDGIFHRFQVAHIQYPHLVYAIPVGQVHLLPQTRDGTDVDPLRVARASHVVYVVVHAEASLTLLGSTKFRQTADVAPVVVAQQQDDIVWHLHPLVVEVLHFLIECPHLRHILGFLALHLSEQFALLFYYLLHQPDGGFVFHCLVTVTTHTYGVHRLPRLGTLHTASPEVHHLVVVGGEAPLAVTLAALPVLLGQCHRLVVRGAHHDAHPVGQRAILLVVVVEGTAPHGRPHVVGLQTQQQFEYVLVHLGIDAAELLVAPVAKRGPLVVDEYTTVSHFGLAVGIYTSFYIYVILMPCGDVGPPVPRRHTHLATELVDAVDGAALVAAGNHQGLFHSRCGVVNNLQEILLPLTFYVFLLNLS